MEFFRIKKDIPFMKYALVLNAISFITFALAVFFLVTTGLHLSRGIHRRHGHGGGLRQTLPTSSKVRNTMARHGLPRT